ncbi:MAG: Ger(x)C family spore germination protein [Bacillota bacterium]|jgi:spore germination protein KC
MHRIKILTCIFLIAFISLMAAGCWDHRELNELSIVFGVGLDTSEKPGNIKMTAEIIKPGEMKGGGASQDVAAKTAPYLNLSSTGTTGFQAIRDFNFSTSRRLFWANNSVIIFGKDLARKGVAGHLDIFLRDPEIRRTTWILVADGEAVDILNTDPEVENTPAMNINKILDHRYTTSEILGTDLQHFATRLLSKTTAPVTPIIKAIEDNKIMIPKIIGTAIFKKDKMTGQLNQKETRGLLWVLNEVSSGTIVVDSPKGSEKVSLEIIRSSSKIIPEIKNGEIFIKIEIEEEANIADQMTSEDLTKLELLKIMEKHQSDEIRKEILATLKKARELNTDIFGFGDAVHRKYPVLWKKIENNWDDYFPHIQVTFNIEARIRRVGMITKPVIPK